MYTTVLLPIYQHFGPIDSNWSKMFKRRVLSSRCFLHDQKQYSQSIEEEYLYEFLCITNIYLDFFSIYIYITKCIIVNEQPTVVHSIHLVLCVCVCVCVRVRVCVHRGVWRCWSPGPGGTWVDVTPVCSTRALSRPHWSNREYCAATAQVRTLPYYRISSVVVLLVYVV